MKDIETRSDDMVAIEHRPWSAEKNKNPMSLLKRWQERSGVSDARRRSFCVSYHI